MCACNSNDMDAFHCFLRTKPYKPANVLSVQKLHKSDLYFQSYSDQKKQKSLNSHTKTIVSELSITECSGLGGLGCRQANCSPFDKRASDDKFAF